MVWSNCSRRLLRNSFTIMLAIMISLSIISIIVFTCNTEAQGPSGTTLNERTLDKIVNQTNAFEGIPHIM